MNSKRLLGGNRKKEQNIKEGITVWRDTEKIIIYTENDKNIYDETKSFRTDVHIWDTYWASKGKQH